MKQTSTIPLKSAIDIEIMAEGGQKLATILRTMVNSIQPGVKTGQLESLATNLIQQSGGTSTFKGFHGYPATSCISINDEVVHGIPGGRVIHEGDLVGVDIGLKFKGFCTDMAITVGVGRISPEAERLIKTTEEAFWAGMEQVKPGCRVGDISHAVESIITAAGFGIVRDLTGHGIGKDQWEEPPVPNFGSPGTGPVLREGMTVAIEPMVTLGKPAIKQLADGWTIVTVDGSLAAHYEHTVAVTDKGYRLLTKIEA